MVNTEQIPYETYQGGVRIDSGTITRQLSPDEIAQNTIRQNIITARQNIATAMTALNAANTAAQAATTNAQALAALQQLSAATAQYTQANNAALLALVQALKYVGSRLDTGA